MSSRRFTDPTWSTVDQHDYGTAAKQPDVAVDELNILCNEFYKREIQVSDHEIEKIERETRSQADNPLWYHHRRLRLTASNFGMVAKRRAKTPVAKAVKNLLYTRSMDSKAMRWGRVHEDDARQEYVQLLKLSHPQATVKLTGLIVDKHEPCLGGSPDGLVSIPKKVEPDGVLEIKCPHSAAEKQFTPQEACSLKNFPCKLVTGVREDDIDLLRLKRKHNYFYQVQGLMAITGRPWCDFVVWTPKGLSVERISFDVEFWSTVKPKLVDFHRRAILPELALPRHPSGQPIREPPAPESTQPATQTEEDSSED